MMPLSPAATKLNFSRSVLDDQDSGCVMIESYGGIGGAQTQPALSEQLRNRKQQAIIQPKLAWAPAGVDPELMQTYFNELPVDRVPFVGSSGERWRMEQLRRQNPPQDSDPNFCRSLSEVEVRELRAFEERRRRECFGQAAIAAPAAQKNVAATRAGDEPLGSPTGHAKLYCHQCKLPIFEQELAIVAPSHFPAGRTLWHPRCFICVECHEILVDLIYYCHGENVFCGRHNAEQMKPRCAHCDELIFGEQCTEAEGRVWHSRHFVCSECRCPLGGQQYVMDTLLSNNQHSNEQQQQPFCMPCFRWRVSTENVTSKSVVVSETLRCATCLREIPPGLPHITQDSTHWHADERCFRCIKCYTNLLGRPFNFRQKVLHCEDVTGCGARNSPTSSSSNTTCPVGDCVEERQKQYSLSSGCSTPSSFYLPSQHQKNNRKGAKTTSVSRCSNCSVVQKPQQKNVHGGDENNNKHKTSPCRQVRFLEFNGSPPAPPTKAPPPPPPPLQQSVVIATQSSLRAQQRLEENVYETVMFTTTNSVSTTVEPQTFSTNKKPLLHRAVIPPPPAPAANSAANVCFASPNGHYFGEKTLRIKHHDDYDSASDSETNKLNSSRSAVGSSYRQQREIRPRSAEGRRSTTKTRKKRASRKHKQLRSTGLSRELFHCVSAKERGPTSDNNHQQVLFVENSPTGSEKWQKSHHVPVTTTSCSSVQNHTNSFSQMAAHHRLPFYHTSVEPRKQQQRKAFSEVGIERNNASRHESRRREKEHHRKNPNTKRRHHGRRRRRFSSTSMEEGSTTSAPLHSSESSDDDSEDEASIIFLRESLAAIASLVPPESQHQRRQDRRKRWTVANATTSSNFFLPTNGSPNAHHRPSLSEQSNQTTHSLISGAVPYNRSATFAYPNYAMLSMVPPSLNSQAIPAPTPPAMWPIKKLAITMNTTEVMHQETLKKHSKQSSNKGYSNCAVS